MSCSNQLLPDDLLHFLHTGCTHPLPEPRHGGGIKPPLRSNGPKPFHRDSAEMHPVDVLMKPASHVTIVEVMQVLQEMKTDHETDCLGTAAAPAVVPGESLRQSIPIDPICQFDQLVIGIKMVLEYPIKYAILIIIVTGHGIYLLCLSFAETTYREYTSWPLFFNDVAAHFSV